MPLGAWMSASGNAGAPSDCSDSIVASQSDRETWLTGREVDFGWDATCRTNCSASWSRVFCNSRRSWSRSSSRFVTIPCFSFKMSLLKLAFFFSKRQSTYQKLCQVLIEGGRNGEQFSGRSSRHSINPPGTAGRRRWWCCGIRRNGSNCFLFSNVQTLVQHSWELGG